MALVICFPFCCGAAHNQNLSPLTDLEAGCRRMIRFLVEKLFLINFPPLMCAFSASVVAFLSCVQIVMRQICVGFPFNFQQLFFVDVCGSLTNGKMVPLGCQFRRLFSLLLRPLSSVSLSFVLCRKEITRSETYKTTNSRRLSALDGGRNMRCRNGLKSRWKKLISLWNPLKR